MRALRAAQGLRRALATEIVDHERASVTSRGRASKLVGRRGWDGTRCFTEKCPTKLVLVPQLRHHQAVVGVGPKRDGTGRSGGQCPTSWDRSGRTGRDTFGTRCFIERSWQISTSSHSTVLPPDSSHGQNLPAGGDGSPADLGRYVRPVHCAGWDTGLGWHGGGLSPAGKPVGSSEVTRTVGQVDPAGQQKVDPPGRVPHI